jgi:hypothetical protein
VQKNFPEEENFSDFRANGCRATKIRFTRLEKNVGSNQHV